MSSLAMAKNADTDVAVLVVDLADMSCFEAIAHDVSDKGCWVFSDRVDLLKEEVGLRLSGYDKLVRGTVIAYGDNEAQISFEVKNDAPTEKRREIRRTVLISAIVCGQKHPIAMKCRIVDASKSGCRIEGDNLDRLPDAIEISIPGLDLPIASAIVWRKDNQAGVKLSWPFEPEPDPETETEQLLRKLQQERQREKSRPKPKKRITAFGR